MNEHKVTVTIGVRLGNVAQDDTHEVRVKIKAVAGYFQGEPFDDDPTVSVRAHALLALAESLMLSGFNVVGFLLDTSEYWVGNEEVTKLIRNAMAMEDKLGPLFDQLSYLIKTDGGS